MLRQCDSPSFGFGFSHGLDLLSGGFSSPFSPGLKTNPLALLITAQRFPELLPPSADKTMDQEKGGMGKKVFRTPLPRAVMTLSRKYKSRAGAFRGTSTNREWCLERGTPASHCNAFLGVTREAEQTRRSARLIGRHIPMVNGKGIVRFDLSNKKYLCS